MKVWITKCRYLDRVVIDLWFSKPTQSEEMKYFFGDGHSCTLTEEMAAEILGWKIKNGDCVEAKIVK